MPRSEHLRRPAAALLRMLAVAAAYWVGGQIGLLQQVVVEGAVVTPLWPPTGIALACLLWMGAGVWPGIAVGALATVATLDSLDAATLGVLAGNTLAPLAAYLMLRRIGFRMELDRLRDGLALVFLGALGGMLISATFGVGTQVWNGSLSLGEFWPVWSAWWAGDAMGVLVITPVLLLLPRARLPRDTRPYWWTEAAALCVTAAAVALLVTRIELSLLFLVFPVLIWAALRFQLPGAAPCALLISVLAISAATSGAGPFAGRSLLELMVVLQALNGCAALTALLLAAIITEQIGIRRRVEQACSALAEVVDQLAPGETAHLWPVVEGGKVADRMGGDD
ncbi:MASE1 domain-containing protein [Streptomyces sp. ISL-10]|uniref:MASE1 domain-containing protein n=1 Tax=Streptomyces sp. ISL-10 TaxID=2819172 RepID=UPI001BE86A77|nr:MASE1 domain-containing protein [Streptomyces sp. ISL-10]MBT2365514.1 MASE1 domain-containing protein [Streptomyces sp. ISL-10]